MKPVMVALAVMAMAAFPAQSGADDINVSGFWTITMETPRGPRNQDVEFVQTGENLKVIPTAGERAPSEGTGTVKGDKIAWSWKVESPRGEVTITFAGTVSGDTMSGTMSRVRGESKWTAKRKPSSSSAPASGGAL